MFEYALYDTETRAPETAVPPGSCDSQVHIFGDRDRFPVKPDAAYVVHQATVDAMLDMHRVLGIERGVIVQSTAYGNNHDAMIDALHRAGPNYLGCGVIDDSTSDEQLGELHDAGMRGARFNYHPKLKNRMPDPDEVIRIAKRVAPLGWHLKLHLNSIDPKPITNLLSEIEAPIIIDHMGPLQYEYGLDDPNFAHICELLGRGNWWVMLSNGDRRSVAGYPWDDATAYAREYIATAPNRVLWATDWPHPLHSGPIPNDGELLDLLERYAPDPVERRRILVDNPQEIFQFT